MRKILLCSAFVLCVSFSFVNFFFSPVCYAMSRGEVGEHTEETGQREERNRKIKATAEIGQRLARSGEGGSRLYIYRKLPKKITI